MTTPLFKIEHPYYANQGNYYSNDCHYTADSWEDFLSEMGRADLDMNLLYRWDWNRPDPLIYEDGEEMPNESLQLFYVGQRKAKLYSFEVFNVTREQEPEIRAWLTVRAEHMRQVWEPLLGSSTADSEGGAPPDHVRRETLEEIKGLLSRTAEIGSAMREEYRDAWRDAVNNAMRVVQEAIDRG